MRARATAGVTACFLAAQLLAAPCGAACHPSEHQHSSDAAEPAEHSCHEASAAESGLQVAASPTGCAHNHDSGESALAPAASSRGDHRASALAMAVTNQMPHVVASSLAFAAPTSSSDPIAPAPRFSSPLRI